MACLPLALVMTRRSDCDMLKGRNAVTCLLAVLKAIRKLLDQISYA